MGLDAVALWAGIAAIPTALFAMLIAWRGIRVAKAQLQSAVHQGDLQDLTSQVGLLKDAHMTKVTYLEARHAECERQLFSLQERLNVHREELTTVRTQQFQLLVTLEQQRLELTQLRQR